MKKISISELRNGSSKIENLLGRGEEIQITKRGKVIARLVPEAVDTPKQMPDLGRLRSMFGDKVLAVSGADLLNKDRDKY